MDTNGIRTRRKKCILDEIEFIMLGESIRNSGCIMLD